MTEMVEGSFQIAVKITVHGYVKDCFGIHLNPGNDLDDEALWFLTDLRSGIAVAMTPSFSEAEKVLSQLSKRLPNFNSDDDDQCKKALSILKKLKETTCPGISWSRKSSAKFRMEQPTSTV